MPGANLGLSLLVSLVVQTDVEEPHFTFDCRRNPFILLLIGTSARNGQPRCGQAGPRIMGLRIPGDCGIAICRSRVWRRVA